MKILPTVTEISREAVTVIAGAIVAALIISQLPGVKAWIQRQWE